MQGHGSQPNPAVLSAADGRALAGVAHQVCDPAMSLEERCQWLSRRVCELTGAHRCVVSEVQIVNAPWPLPLSVLGDFGYLDSSDIELQKQCHTDGEAADLVAGAAVMACASVRTVTRTALQSVGESKWTRCAMYDRYFRPVRMNDLMHCMSATETRPGWVGWIGVGRQTEDGAFGEREVAIVEVIQSEIGPWLWGQVACLRAAGGTHRRSEPDSSLYARLEERLSPAERRVLAYLLTDKTEAQIGALIHRSKHTVHDHAKRIYAQLGVASRVELVVVLSGAAR